MTLPLARSKSLQGARFSYMSRQSEDDEAHPSPNHVKAGLRPETEDLQWQRPSPSHYPLALLRTYLIKTFTERRVVMVSHHIDWAGVTNEFINYPH